LLSGEANIPTDAIDMLVYSAHKLLDGTDKPAEVMNKLREEIILFSSQW
jgi:hypothetical protein